MGHALGTQKYMVIGDTVTILLVEDNDIDAEAVRRAFKKNNVENPVVRATDGVKALAILRGENQRESVPRPYLILLDLNMPRMNGIEFLEELRNDQNLADSIVFVLTTSDLEQDKLAAYSNQVAGYLVKSHIGEGFISMVEMLDAYWRVVTFPPSRAA
ncbi:MAG: response regulator [Pseudomonadota bacterium]